ncbi:Uncharacterised protein [Mycobacterium tuberculosis]|nr:Uncharacterised protein [Mycobacterium tuberculosis]
MLLGVCFQLSNNLFKIINHLCFSMLRAFFICQEQNCFLKFFLRVFKDILIYCFKV